MPRGRHHLNYSDIVFDFFLGTDYERALDVIELAFKTLVEGQFPPLTVPPLSPTDAIAELNARFREHGVGYQFESGELIRVDSEILHQEAVRPALALLRDPAFAGANDEYLRAHEHYRHGRKKECLADCLKAFESTMKVICTKRGWAYDEKKDTARRLIEVCFENDLIPALHQSHFSSLRASLESGVPTVRNRGGGGHGQGATVVTVPDYLPSYLLHLTGAAILLLINAERQLP